MIVISILITQPIFGNEMAISVASHKHGFLLIYSNREINWSVLFTRLKRTYCHGRN